MTVPKQPLGARPGAKPRPYTRAVEPHLRPQIVQAATLRKGRHGWYMTFAMPQAFRLLEVDCTVAIPRDMVEGAKAPAYVRLYVDASRQDAPGEVVIDGIEGAPREVVREIADWLSAEGLEGPAATVLERWAGGSSGDDEVG